MAALLFTSSLLNEGRDHCWQLRRSLWLVYGKHFGDRNDQYETAAQHISGAEQNDQHHCLLGGV